MAEQIQPPKQTTPKSSHRWRTLTISALSGIVVIAVVVVGISWWRVHSTFQEVNSIPPLPSVISAESLGVESTAVIDTGPAQAAIATAEAQRKNGGRLLLPTPTPDALITAPAQESPHGGTPAAHLINPGSGIAHSAASLAGMIPSSALFLQSVQSIPSSSPQASPAASPVALPSTPTPTLSSIERIANGDFEAGADPWYLEAGASVSLGMARSGASALHLGPASGYANQQFVVNTGSTYYASAWAVTDQPGSTLEIGVAYYDADGNRRKDLEPSRPIFSVTTTYQQFAFEFMPPTGITLAQLTFFTPDNPGTIAVDDVSLRAELPPDLLAPPTELYDDNAITILVMGVDARPGEPIDQGVRPDSLMVVRLNPDTGSCRVLAIPRDTRVNLPGYGLTKVNHALAVGGIPYEQLVVEQYLGLAVDHYVLVDFTGFSELVDSIGGIDINVPAPFTASDGTLFPAGEQHLNGTQALAYSRFRGDADGDFGRIERQQQLIRAMMAKAGDINPVDAVTELVPALGDRLRTDLGQSDMLSLAKQYGSSCTDDSVEFLHLDGSIATFNDPLLNMPLSYVVVAEAELRRKVAELIGTS